MSIRLADPRPAFCSACFNSDADVRYVDFDAAWDGAVVLDEKTGVARLSPGGVPMGSDDLYLCEACVKTATELLGLKPELNRRQLNEIRRLEVENRHWKDYAKTLEATLQERPEAPPRAVRKAVAA